LYLFVLRLPFERCILPHPRCQGLFFEIHCPFRRTSCPPGRSAFLLKRKPCRYFGRTPSSGIHLFLELLRRMFPAVTVHLVFPPAVYRRHSCMSSTISNQRESKRPDDQIYPQDGASTEAAKAVWLPTSPDVQHGGVGAKACYVPVPRGGASRYNSCRSNLRRESIRIGSQSLTTRLKLNDGLLGMMGHRSTMKQTPGLQYRVVCAIFHSKRIACQ